MIYKNKAEIRYDTKWQYTVPWVTPVGLFVFALKLFSVDPSQILQDASNELFNTHKIVIGSPCNDIYFGSLVACYAKH